MVVSKLTIDIPALRGVAGAGVDDFQLLAIDVDVPVDLYRRDGTEGNGVGGRTEVGIVMADNKIIDGCGGWADGDMVGVLLRGQIGVVGVGGPQITPGGRGVAGDKMDRGLAAGVMHEFDVDGVEECELEVDNAVAQGSGEKRVGIPARQR